MVGYYDEKYRFLRNSEQHEKMEKIRELKIFSHYNSIMIASAVIGFNAGKAYCVPIDTGAQDRVQIIFFDKKDLEIIDLIAYAHTGEQSVLHSVEKYKIFERYANGGFNILYKELDIHSDLTIDNRSELLLKYYNLIISKSLLRNLSI